ncbi:MAG: ATP-grasp domain-containing protein [Ruminococcus sp.]|nr:ATP-grasp domain-containing protein [Ruminococcus sp.]
MNIILLLGGSSQQVIAIETAKRLGFYTVLCDYLPDNPGQYVADKFYLLSTTDKQAMLDVAEKENIDGVLAYASDPAAPTAAYVAEQLGLHTNPAESVEILCNKDKFRKFLSEYGFNTPYANGYSDIETAINDTDKFTLPVIIKPVDSSGSKGATVLRSWDNVKEAVEFAFSFSRCKRIVIEEFIEKKHPYLIGGDIFVWDGKVIMWGLMNCHRDGNVNPLVPVGKSYPPELDDEDLQKVKDTLQDMVDKLHITFGAMNVELVVDKNGRVFPIDVGPRNGGNMIPDLLGYIFGVDVVEMTVKAAMGETPDIKMKESVPYYATHNLHADRNGKFAGVKFSSDAKKYIIKKCIYKKHGDEIEYFDNASKALGIVFFKFDSAESMSRILGNINEHITIEYMP